MRVPLKVLRGVASIDDTLTVFTEGGVLKLEALDSSRMIAALLEVPAEGVVLTPVYANLLNAVEALLELGGEADLSFGDGALALTADPVTVEVEARELGEQPLRFPQPARFHPFPLKRVYAAARRRGVEHVAVEARSGRAVFTPPGIPLSGVEGEFRCKVYRDLLLRAYEAARSLAEPMWVGFLPKKFGKTSYAVLVVQSKLGSARMTVWVAPTID